MVGSELASETGYIISRAAEELDVRTRADGLARRLAAVYVRLLGVPEVGAHVRIRSAVAHVPRSCKRVLDVGCGPGMLLGQLRGRVPQAEIVGIEVNSEAAQIAKATHPYANIIEGDFLTAALPTQSFDCIISIDVLEHIPDEHLHAFMSRIVDLLAPSGKLIVHVPAINQRRHFRRFDDWEHHDHEREGFSPSLICNLAKDSGLTNIVTSGTFGYWGSLGWELNMMFAGHMGQAAVFPLALLMTTLDRWFGGTAWNGVLLVAERAEDDPAAVK